MERKIKSNVDLQIRMTAFVTAVVLLTSAIVLLVTALRVRNGYERMLNERISGDLAAITRIMEQRMLRVEGSVGTMAAASSHMAAEGAETDSLLCRSLASMEGVYGVSMALDGGSSTSAEGVFVRYAHRDDNGGIMLDSYPGRTVKSSSDWIHCFDEGKSYWGYLSKEYSSGGSAVCYFVPLTDAHGARAGMASAFMKESDLTSFVTEYKLSKDVDISIYDADGTMIVAPDDYILKLSPKELLLLESSIDDIGWKVVLSADRRIIGRAVRQALISLLLIFALMFIVVALAVRYTVRFVAKPFIEDQQRVEKEKVVMENEIQLAARAQNELVPHVFPPFPDRKGIDLSACLHPARSVGGDIYDYFLNGDNLYFCIGDVSGKGVQGSLFMAATHYLFRSAAAGMSVADAAMKMNVSLCADNEQCRFVTFWMGCLDLTSGALEYVNAGHDSPIILHGGKAGTLPLSENMPLGVIEDTEFISGNTTLIPGDILLLYTDGVTEAMDAAGHEFGKERLHETVETSADSDAEGLIGAVLSRVREFSPESNQSDDITMLCMKFIEKESINN